MEAAKAVALGLIQGLTEFLPVSSSGHLVLGKAILGVDTQGVAFEVLLHLATFLAVLTMLRKLIGSLVAGGASAVAALLRGRLTFSAWLKDPAIEMLLFLVVGTIPAAVIGVVLEKRIEPLFASPEAACLLLLATGVILWCTRFVQPGSREPGMRDVLLIGSAQAAAILPGVSRSGVTIATALFRGIGDRRAAEFSFLLALPAIFGAAILEVPEVVESLRSDAPGGLGAVGLGLGMVAAYGSGCVAIRILFGFLRRGFFPRFAYYCWALGLVGLLIILGR